MPKGKGTRPNRAKTIDHKHQLEIIKAEGDIKLQQDIIRYVGEDLRSQLLIIALAGTGIASILKLYQDATIEHERNTPDIPMPPLWAWFFAGGLTGVMVGQTIGSMFDSAKQTTIANSNNPYALIGGMVSAANNVSGLAWGALYAAIILGEGGLGGVLEKAGGGGFGQIASAAVI